jgi:surface antigen
VNTKSSAIKIMVFCLYASLTACSMLPKYNNNTSSGVGVSDGREAPIGAGVAVGVQTGGTIGTSMDALDKVKLSHALDKAPGKSTTWTNDNNGVTYTATPTKKISLNGNPFCRQYEVVAVKGENHRTVNGTACVAADGAWSEVK